MSRTRYPSEFRARIEAIGTEYKRIYAPQVEKIRKKYTDNPLKKVMPHIDESLEAHSRAYVINALLEALNWRLNTSPEDGLPNLVPEAPVTSAKSGTTRFLDYLGFENKALNPLLIVEAKRPKSPLPQLKDLSSKSPSLGFPEIISRGLKGEVLLADWNIWFSSIADYVRSTHNKTKKVAKRVVVTNGDWLILFLDPADAFLEEGCRNPNRILVFPDFSEIKRRSGELFEILEHSVVLGETPATTPGELGFHVTAATIDRIMHGLRLRYNVDPGIYNSSPSIKVAPVVFLRSNHGAWLHVETPPREYEIPHQESKLQIHLNDVRKAATSILHQVNGTLGTHRGTHSLSRHYEDDDAFEPIRGVVQSEPDNFLIAVGENTHYLREEPSIPDCPYHDWQRSKMDGVESNPWPVSTRSISPRSFFISSEVHHCAHRDVASAKSSSITAGNKTRCGLRSGEEGDAFCEIWRFESYLCCRTCAFEKVCTRADVFHLPCEVEA